MIELGLQRDERFRREERHVARPLAAAETLVDRAVHEALVHLQELHLRSEYELQEEKRRETDYQREEEHEGHLDTRGQGLEEPAVAAHDDAVEERQSREEESHLNDPAPGMLVVGDHLKVLFIVLEAREKSRESETLVIHCVPSLTVSFLCRRQCSNLLLLCQVYYCLLLFTGSSALSCNL